MKNAVRSLLLVALMILCAAGLLLMAGKDKARAQGVLTPPLKGFVTVIPFPGKTEDALAASIKGATIPLNSFPVKASKNGTTYTDVIVGQSPFSKPLTATHVKILLVPMVIHIGSSTFSSIVANNCGGSLGHTDLANFLASPILKPVIFDGATGAGHGAKVNGVIMGTDTYNGTHRRAEFLKAIGGASSPYRTIFDVSVAATQTISAATTSGHSQILVGGSCSLLGGLDFNFFNNYFVTKVLPAVHADPTSFVILLMRDTVFYNGSNCCILGYHGTASNKQTYSPTDYDTTGDWTSPGIKNVSIAAHEIGEWLDDPLGTNPTPAWGNIGQVSGCQNNWEVGDPLTGTDYPAIKMANGVTYNPQETVFWSWYYSKDHDPFFQSMTAGGKYSMHGTFGGPSKVCPPGGTFPN
ncbi:MAG: hypothetical protein J2P49_05355 [Methylocapsa sp.]|nr:hypothetical protein [Methylocapsa sp.]